MHVHREDYRADTHWRKLCTENGYRRALEMLMHVSNMTNQ
jgi:hypothetical protein